MKKLFVFTACLLILLGRSAVPAEDDPVDVIEALAKWNDRLTPEQLKYKYGRMALSPFVFLRGSNHLYWQKFHNDSRLAQFGHAKTKTWLQGDLHAENYGSFDNDKGEVVYNVNDFDDSVIADYQLDLWRMAVSLVLIARENQERENKPLEITEIELAEVIDEFSEAYLDTLKTYRGDDDETKFYFTIDTTKGKLQTFLEKTKDKDSRKSMLDKWSKADGNDRTFSTNLKKLQAIDDPLRDQIKNAMAGYRATLTSGLADDEEYFEVKDIARRIRAGTGSVGAPRYYVVIEGKDEEADDDRILDVKQQCDPTAYVFSSAQYKEEYDDRFENHAQRHAIAYRALTVHTDDHLGWMKIGNDFYSVRERSPYKETYKTKKLNKVAILKKFSGYWGAVLATAHARADKDDKQSDETFISYSIEKQVGEATDGKHKQFRQLVRDVALNYASQVQRDYKRFKDERAPGG